MKELRYQRARKFLAEETKIGERVVGAAVNGSDREKEGRSLEMYKNGERGRVRKEMPRVNQEEGSSRMSRREREGNPERILSCVYIYIYKVSTRMLP